MEPVAADKFAREPQPAWVETIAVPKPDATSAPVVMLLADTQYSWTGVKARFFHRALKVNETAALGDVGQQTIEFNPEYQTVALHTLRLVRDQSVIDKRDSVKPRFLQREQDMENGIYDGVRTVVLLIDDLRIGDIVEIAYTITGSNPVFGDKVAEVAPWENSLPIQKRRLSAIFPADRNIRHRYVGGLDPAVRSTPKTIRKNGSIQWVFEQSNLKAVDYEERIPAEFEPMTLVQFSEYENWRDVAATAETLFNVPEPEDDEFGGQIETLRAIADPKQRLASALRFVQSDIRYTSISIGVNSHLPYPPSVVLGRRYGDCKDKSVLLVTMLKKLGIQARPALVSMHSRRGFADWLPSPMLFDHVIVRVDLQGSEYWVDPTALQQPANLDALGSLHGGSEVLVADPATQSLATIPMWTAEVIEEQQIVELHGVDVAADLEVRTTYSGAGAENLRANLSRATSAVIEKHYLDTIRVIYPGARWQKKYEIVDDAPNNRITVVRNFKVDEIAELEDGERRIYRRADRILDFLDIPNTAARRAPYSIGRPVRLVFSQKIHLPTELALQHQQENSAVSNGYFRMKKSIRCRGTTAQVDFELTSTAETVPANAINEFSNEIRKARSLLNTSLALPD